MNRQFVSYTSMICCLFLIALGVASCNRTLKSERLKLVDGAIDACLLVTPTEVKTVTGFDVVADRHPVNPGGTSCIYPKNNGNTALMIFVTTDATWKKAYRIGTAEDQFNISKAEALKHPEMYTVEDIDGLGSQANFSNREDFEFAVRVLNNGIFYEFTNYGSSGTNRDKLIQIAKIALQRAP